MSLFRELEDLGIAPTWCLMLTALEWPAESPLLAPVDVQTYAAQILSSGPEHDQLVLEVAAAPPLERDTTIGAVRQLATASGCSALVAGRTLLLILLTRELVRWDSSRPTETVPRVLDVWAGADWPEDMPLTMRRWLDGSVSPSELFSTQGCESLQRELRDWTVEQLHRVRGAT